MSVQTRSDEAQSIIRADTPYPAMLLIGRLDAIAGAVASFDFQNIPATFSKLVIDLYARGDKAATSADINIGFNNDGSAIYDSIRQHVRHSASLTTWETLEAGYVPIAVMAAASAPASAFDQIRIEIANYANTNGHKTAISEYGIKLNTTTTNIILGSGRAWYRSTNAINRITLTPLAGNFAQYSTARLYGVV